MHLQDALGCIISVPGVIGGFGSFNITPPHPGDPSGVDQVPDCISAATIHGLTLFNQCHRVAFSAASVMGPKARLFAAPEIPNTATALHVERPANL